MKNAILNNDLSTLKKVVNKVNVNKVIFTIFDDDEIPNWTAIIKISQLKKERFDKKRYNGIDSIYDTLSDCKLAKVLVKAGADLNYKDKNGHTALMYCVYYKNFKLLKFLIKAGADLNVTNNSGMTALLIAGYYNRPKYAKYLIKSGANDTIKNNNGETFFDYKLFKKDDK